MNAIPWLILVGVGGFAALKWWASRKDPLAQQVIDALACDQASPVASDVPLAKNLTLKQAIEIKTRLGIKDSARLLSLYTMTLPINDRQAVVSFINPQKNGVPIDGKPEEN